ncbi:MAG: methylenetetrahydrofolate--tRNA-(uracil(54)-C(5))-methyltransferase (FADH(2)-oxidizing) TrmFO [candidate division WOR-3 bacterium]
MIVVVIGGGLAGCEASLQLSQRGVRVKLFEMRPLRNTPAHKTNLLAELVCSNSLKSCEISNGHGLLKEELKLLNSVLLKVAYESRVPAGKSLSVDRLKFAHRITGMIENDKNIELIKSEVTDIPDGLTVIATGPLTSDRLAESLSKFLGRDFLFFYDAISPIISYDSIDLNKTFRGARYGIDDSYINCPLNKSEYETFCNALAQARTYPLHDFEDPVFFEGCRPIEDTLKTGLDTLRFGAFKPVGFDREYYAIVQLRPENLERSMYSLVGCQTKMLISEQERVFRMIPALKKAKFLRYGSVHRNTYIQAPECLEPTLATKKRPDLFLAGQITGVEGYVESIATGLLAGINIYRTISGLQPIVPPPETMVGGLIKYITTPNPHFAPMNANFGLLPNREGRREKASRSLEVLKEWMRREKI